MSNSYLWIVYQLTMMTNFCYWNTFWEGRIKIFYIQKNICLTVSLNQLIMSSKAVKHCCGTYSFIQHTVYPHFLPKKCPDACIHRYAQSCGWNRTIYIINSQARASSSAVVLRVSHTTKNITQGLFTQMCTKRVASPETPVTSCDLGIHSLSK